MTRGSNPARTATILNVDTPDTRTPKYMQIPPRTANAIVKCTCLFQTDMQLSPNRTEQSPI